MINKILRDWLPTFSKVQILGQSGKIGYVVAWFLGVPAWVLIMIYLIRG